MCKMHTLLSNTGVLRSLTVAVLSFVFTMAAHAAGATVTVDSNNIYASANVADAISIELRVAGGPNDYYATQSSDTGSVSWDAPYGLADGAYRYEVFVVVGTESVDDDGVQSYRDNGQFTVESGTIHPAVAAPSPPDVQGSLQNRSLSSTLEKVAKSVLDFLVPSAHAQDVTASGGFPAFNYDDTDVAGLETRLFGADVGGEDFWGIWSTARANYMSRWYSSANSQDSLVIEPTGDIGLANDSVYIDRSLNQMGIGTITPTRNLHIIDPTPAVVLEDTAGVTWTINDNTNAAFFDITSFHTGTNTKRIPFFMHYTAPNNSLYMNNIGNIGMGTSAPQAPLHITRVTGANLLVQNTSTTAAERVLFKLVNNGKNRFEIVNGANSWTFDNDGNFFNLSKVGTGANEFRVASNGDGFFRRIAYAVRHDNYSSRTAKKDFKELNEREILTKLVNLPVTEWRYKQDDSRHFGPVAEDFQATFGLGDGKHISTVDTAGVTMAAIQGLYQVMQDKDKENSELRKEKDAELEELKAENRALAERLQVLEKLILYKEVALVQ